MRPYTIADLAYKDYPCEICGQAAAWRSGGISAPHHYLCLSCANDWSAYFGDALARGEAGNQRRLNDWWPRVFQSFIDHAQQRLSAGAEG